MATNYTKQGCEIVYKSHSLLGMKVEWYSSRAWHFKVKSFAGHFCLSVRFGHYGFVLPEKIIIG